MSADRNPEQPARVSLALPSWRCTGAVNLQESESAISARTALTVNQIPSSPQLWVPRLAIPSHSSEAAPTRLLELWATAVPAVILICLLALLVEQAPIR